MGQSMVYRQCAGIALDFFFLCLPGLFWTNPSIGPALGGNSSNGHVVSGNFVKGLVL
jgi:hypothetical protein